MLCEEEVTKHDIDVEAATYRGCYLRSGRSFEEPQDEGVAFITLGSELPVIMLRAVKRSVVSLFVVVVPLDHGQARLDVSVRRGILGHSLSVTS